MAVEIYKHEAGKIYIATSDKKLSIGLLVLDPKKEYAKHNRPVLEQLIQIKGSCTMRLFENDKPVKEVTLKEGDKLEIPANQFHIHGNPFGEASVTMWKFDGDITEVINGIRSSMAKA